MQSPECLCLRFSHYGPDVVFVVDAAVVFAQLLPKKKKNHLREEIFDRSGGGKWIRVLHTNKTIMRFA